MYDNETKVLVTATDDLGIKGYEYVYGSNNSGIIENKEFIYSDSINEVFVNIYDKVNNKVLINIDIIVILTLIASLFHITAIFGLIIYPLLRIKRRAIKVAVSVAVLCVAIGCQGVIGGISELSAFEHFSMYLISSLLGTE